MKGKHVEYRKNLPGLRVSKLTLGVGPWARTEEPLRLSRRNGLLTGLSSLNTHVQKIGVVNAYL